MTKQDILREYFSVADYIAAVNGPNCEVIVHDLSDLKHSIVHIVNGHITNRQVGGSITDFALELLQKDNNMERDYIANYVGTTKNNEKILRSSTFFIKDEEKRIIGLLCINNDITELLRLKDNIDNMIMVSGLPGSSGRPEEHSVKETFDRSIDDFVEEIIQSTLLESGVKLTETSLEEKRELIRKMESKGVFKFKGTVSIVSKLLDVSTQTIYRYLKENANRPDTDSE